MLDRFSVFTKGKASHVATLVGFILSGTGFAMWSALVPALQTRLGLEEAHLGLIILCLGGGSCCLMPFAGFLVRKWGCQQLLSWVFPAAFVLMVLVSVVDTIPAAMCIVALFGAALGTADVTMNIQAAEVERRQGRPLMALFQAMYPVGGLLGSLYMHESIVLHVTQWVAVVVFALGAVVILSTVLPHCLAKPQGSSQEQKSGFRSVLTFPVLLLGLFCFILFLAEGSVMDWSALYMRDSAHAPLAWGPLGYTALSASILIMRLLGDWMIPRVGADRIMLWGGVVCAMAFCILWLLPYPHVALVGFFLVGLGYANMIPVIYSRSGDVAPAAPEAALSIVSSLGYLGILSGPVLVGVIAQVVSLPFAYGCVGILVLVVVLIDFWLIRQKKVSSNAK